MIAPLLSRQRKWLYPINGSRKNGGGRRVGRALPAAFPASFPVDVTREARARPRARGGKRGAWPAAPPSRPPYREWNAGAGPPPRPEPGHLCRESRRGGVRRASPTGSTVPAAAAPGWNSYAPAAAGEALSIRLWSWSQGSTVQVVMPVPAPGWLCGCQGLEALRESPGTGWAAWIRSESTGGDGGAAFAQIWAEIFKFTKEIPEKSRWKSS
ncbi:uncharacterized protein LOC134564555 [Prinia subflava]|uniref:uncharacterized protein LOC134564555 n=1 Tax=Prinia subflava TaxID=208062 RepID=UPI002FE195B5